VHKEESGPLSAWNVTLQGTDLRSGGDQATRQSKIQMLPNSKVFFCSLCITKTEINGCRSHCVNHDLSLRSELVSNNITNFCCIICFWLLLLVRERRHENDGAREMNVLYSTTVQRFPKRERRCFFAPPYITRTLTAEACLLPSHVKQGRAMKDNLLTFDKLVASCFQLGMANTILS
jgi:hypothetical protein